MTLPPPSRSAAGGGMRGLAILAILMLTACGPEQAQVESAQANNVGAPVANAPILHESVGQQQLPPSQDEATQGNAATSPAPHPQTPQPERYRALGTEPFWAVTVKGSTAILERPDKPPASFAVSRNDDGRAVRFLGEGFTMTVAEGPCSDGMSDAIWSDQVSVAFGEGTLKGCGSDRHDPQDAPL